MTRKLAIVVSHPIQHFVHLYRALAAVPSIELKVFFCSRIGVESYFDAEMNQDISWSMDLLSGYDHEFLPEADQIKVSSWKVNNPSVTQALRRFAPDAVLIYGYVQLTALRTLVWARSRGIPALMKSDTDAVRKRHPAKAFAREAVLRPLLSQVSGFVTVGDQNEAMLASLGVPQRKMFRTPFSIDEVVYVDHSRRRPDIRSKLRARYGIPDDAIVGLCVGKLSPRKRPSDLIEAWAHLDSDTARQVHLLYCGNGSELNALRRRVAETGANATLAGFVNVDDLPAHYAAADFLVHPSEYDPHPLVGSEASALGLPLVLSDRVGLIGPTDIGREGFNAIVYPCGDIAALASAMSRLVEDSVLRARMSDAALEVFGECNLAASVAGVVRAVNVVAGANRRIGPSHIGVHKEW